MAKKVDKMKVNMGLKEKFSGPDKWKIKKKVGSADKWKVNKKSKKQK